LWQSTGRSVLVVIAEDEFTRFDRRSRSRRRLNATPFDCQLRDLIPVPEMVMRISKRRDGSYIQGRENLYPRSLFWSHQLDLDVLAEMSNVIADLGGSADAFERYATGAGRADVDGITKEAESLGVFGVPSMLLDGELFWGGDVVSACWRVGWISAWRSAVSCPSGGGSWDRASFYVRSVAAGLMRGAHGFSASSTSAWRTRPCQRLLSA
jgi:hypothetical protein